MSVVARRKKVSRTKKPIRKEYKIELVGKRRSDGSLFVTSPNLGPFSAVLRTGRWEDVIGFLKKFLEVNIGRVVELRLIHDASELVSDSEELPEIPPAYVVAELTHQRASARSTS
ncbi:hypothetical protein [Nitrobacter sp. Nb-311A]|uniref:hypothetical protein n=1 Tax=Nitrobacter sp. Nb-311A TaxID=314253 RepID=UPI00103C4CA7|nr:hypothetical protein [Nitrobacter sp. Nb-311A]